MEEKLMGGYMFNFFKYKNRIVEDDGDDRCRCKMFTL